ncbi:MAG: lysoplasmalogenase family protein, partial [Sphingobacteriales bacterium]|nr:lysoplasmalogenase family protein [Sphingobacteriales bacterium]
MQAIPRRIISIVFWSLCLADLLAIYAGIEILQLMIKPLLIPALMILLVSITTTNRDKKLLLIGLFFSWMGDVWLMLQDHDGLFFMLGLVSFLITHIFYIVFFIRISSAQPSLLQQQP